MNLAASGHVISTPINGQFDTEFFCKNVDTGTPLKHR